VNQYSLYEKLDRCGGGREADTRRRPACSGGWVSPWPDARGQLLAVSPSLGAGPAHFGPAELPVTQGTIECFDGSGGAVEFEDNGRMFGAYLLLGPNAPASLADEARAVLETLRVESAKR
jgi:hypothetical protein